MLPALAEPREAPLGPVLLWLPPAPPFPWALSPPLMRMSECQYLNGNKNMRYLEKHIYNREQTFHFDSDVGHYVADTPLGEPEAKYWNSQPDILEDAQAAVDTYCRHNYEVSTPFLVERRGECVESLCRGWAWPRGKPLRPSTRTRETEHVVSTDVIQNGDWTYQVLVMLETTPQRGDTYACQVEHVSLQHPVTQQWEVQSDAARSKMLTGVGGFVLGLIFLALGLFLYMRKKVRAVGRLGGGSLGCLLCMGWGLRVCPCSDADFVSPCFRAPRSPGCR
uniref:MHC class II antigen n=1 Tax=Buteo japonicus TaxID=224669 RepID=A0A8C0ATW7_9AVES